MRDTATGLLVLAAVLSVALAGCSGPPDLPQAKGPGIPWNTAMVGPLAAPTPLARPQEAH